MADLFDGSLYLPDDPDLMNAQMHFQDLQARYNQTLPSEQPQRAALLKAMFAEIGAGCYIEAPLHANWGGHHAHFGDAVYANYGLTMVDDGEIFVGAHTMLGPNVTLATANHPLAPELRRRGVQYNLPIHIGENCWLGAGVIVLPGIHIGDNTVVGAGAVVTHDLPEAVIAVGNPARVLRALDERDREFYHRDRRIDPKWFTAE